MRIKTLIMSAVLLLSVSIPAHAQDVSLYDYVRQRFDEVQKIQEAIMASLTYKVNAIDQRSIENGNEIKDIHDKDYMQQLSINNLVADVEGLGKEKKKTMSALSKHIENDRQRIVDDSAKFNSNIAIMLSLLSTLAAVASVFYTKRQ